MKQIEYHCCHGGILSVWEHESALLKCAMTFSVFLPSQSEDKDVPFVTFLSGLTCTHENFTTKGGAYRTASKLGIAVIAPDTSPRGEHVPDEPDAYDFGKGAGFYLNATQDPWAEHYQMESYIVEELNKLVCNEFPLISDRQGLMGHSMGGHGAITLYLKHPEIYKSVSAFSPIVAPTQAPWGVKAFSGYLGDNKDTWNSYDACELIAHVKSAEENSEIRIDCGLADPFLEEYLKPQLFEKACRKVGQKLNLNLHEGYDHSYYFIQSFMDDHIHHHSKILTEK
ncbi:MAG: S-formylglutathione hydrolase [Alphaproteobacteria bacterium]|nr:S-formylglutathione hydrolase [Alphaproteobacteria bacterium]